MWQRSILYIVTSLTLSKCIWCEATRPLLKSIGNKETKCTYANKDWDPVKLSNFAVEEIFTTGNLDETLSCLELSIKEAHTLYVVPPDVLTQLEDNLAIMRNILKPLIAGERRSGRIYHSSSNLKPTPFPVNSSEPLPFSNGDPSIQVWDGALTERQCEDIIYLFERSPLYMGNMYSNGQIIHDFDKKKTWEFDISGTAGSNATWAQLDRFLISLLHKYVHLYQESNPGVRMLRNPLGDEGFRMKRYFNDDTEHHGYHADSGHEAECGPKRHIAVLVYLNNVSMGGETVFFNQGIAVQPRCGRVCFFPTEFTHVHAGRRPVSHNKYVISNFLTS